MKNQRHLSQLFQARTGKTTTAPKGASSNPFGYWPARVKRIEKWGE